MHAEFLVDRRVVEPSLNDTDGSVLCRSRNQEPVANFVGCHPVGQKVFEPGRVRFVPGAQTSGASQWQFADVPLNIK